MSRCGIYKITSPTNKIYIGQSWYLTSRLSQYKKLKCKDQLYLYNSLKKHGVENHKFEILILLPNDTTQVVINNYEYFCWEQFKLSGYEMLNIKEPGSNGKHSEETKRKIGLSNKGKPSWAKGKKLSALSENTKQKISIANKGKILSKEHKNKISEGNKNKVVPDEVKKKISNSKLGKVSSLKGKKLKPKSEEHRKNLSESCKGRVITDEQKKKMSEKRKQFWINKKLKEREQI